ncbi:SDR family NAD(P)-dependent oxidoreductase [Shewanella cyperi]|uniref:SDR family NAD(P)-dependent oxidoreductase n=1 Tax=Shewanella cyperi TaxID=2814292 RepID=UPI001A93B021|nr:SDR family NAD(P)-dependent oxidoreductase [Shewanella cyperi]QSX41870.1 SDR family NAD(P)-dependent oxidoreductase [Shewanella cyperi]
MKTICITGATDGLGLAVATALSRPGQSLLIHGRNPEKLAAVRQGLLGLGAEVYAFQADLSDLSQVERMLEQIKQTQSGIDVLINNAGVYKTAGETGSLGIDVRLVVNTLAPFWITQSLLPQLAGGRVINLSSAAQAPLDFDGLCGRKQYSNQMQAYAESKLALTCWTLAMANLYSDKQIRFMAVNPGSLLATSMVREGFGVEGKDISGAVKLLVDMALSPKFADTGGRYFDNDIGSFASPHPDATNPVIQQQLLKLMAQQLWRHCQS